MNHLPDETLSALVDDEPVDAAVVAHVDECATCQSRLDAMRHVVANLAAPVTVPAHLREAAVASALVENTGVSGNLRRIATARRARAKAAAGTARRMSTASAAAALVVALGVGGWLVSQAGDDSNPSTATAGVLGTTRLAVSTTSPSASTPAFFDAGNIGAFDDVAPVAARYYAYAEAPEPGDGGALLAEPPCPKPADRALIWHASLTYNGVPSYARVLTASPSNRVLEIQAQADCAVVASQAI